MPLDPSFPEASLERPLAFGPERTLTFGVEHNLVGTLTLPPAAPRSIDGAEPAPAPRYAVLLTNVGLMPRSGPYRLNVELARRFAALGAPCLRFDLSGLGDSARGSAALTSAEQWVQDTRAAMDEVERQLGVSRFLMIGVCSGADLAHQVAPQDERLAGIVLFDPYLYPTRRSALIALRHRLRAQGVATTALAFAKRLARSLQGVLARGAAADDGEESTLRYGPSAPPLAVFAERLGATVQRGGRVLMLYSGSYPHHHNYEQQTADNLRPFGLADKVEAGIIGESDHVLMGMAGRRAFIERCIDAGERWFGAAHARETVALLQPAAVPRRAAARVPATAAA